jgi:hypothetical protein
MAIPTNPSEIKKDTIYIDVDDEITTIIEKMQNSPQRIVALVLPKRASVLQSVVNMKLLKRTAENAKKHVVLITSETGLLPLAGSVGLLVASTLQSKPAIPVAPDMIDREHVIDEDSGEEFDDFNADTAAEQPIGKLAGMSGTAAAVAAGGAYDDTETIQLDNEDEIGTAAAAAPLAGGAATSAARKSKDKKLKVPNFNKFRVLLIVAVLTVVLLIGGFVYANAVLPKALVTLKTNSSDIPTKANLTLDPAATELDIASNTLPAKIVSKQQTGSQQVSTSGQKNNGTKATGAVTMSSQTCGSSISPTPPGDVPSGTGVSSGGKTFITQQRTTFPDSGTFKNGCVTYAATGSTNVTAQSAGADYNIAPGAFTVAGRSDITAKSTDAFNGGTDNVVKIVAQADIDSAKAKITAADTSGIKDELVNKLAAISYTAISGSLHAGDPVVTPSAAVGDQADTVTVTQVVTYTMYGAKSDDIKTIITTNVTKQIDPTKQQILKDGASSAKFDVATTTASGPLQIGMSATSLAGPDIQVDKLATQLAGKKTGQVEQLVKSIPGVTDVAVKYSPFWVSSVPKKTNKIQIVIEKSATVAPATQSTNDSKP